MEKVTLTEVAGDVIGDVDFPVGPLSPLAARAGAGVGILLRFIGNNDVSFDQVGILFEEDRNQKGPLTPADPPHTLARTAKGAAGHTHPVYCWLVPEAQKRRTPPLKCTRISSNCGPINRCLVRGIVHVPVCWCRGRG